MPSLGQSQPTSRTLARAVDTTTRTLEIYNTGTSAVAYAFWVYGRDAVEISNDQTLDNIVRNRGDYTVVLSFTKGSQPRQYRVTGPIVHIEMGEDPNNSYELHLNGTPMSVSQIVEQTGGNEVPSGDEVPTPPETDAPVADFNISPTDPSVGTTVTFNASPTQPGSAEIQSYVWNIGGQQHTGQQVDVPFDSPGIYNATLTVTNGDARMDTVTKSVEVIQPTPGPDTGTGTPAGQGLSLGLLALGGIATAGVLHYVENGGWDR